MFVMERPSSGAFEVQLSGDGGGKKAKATVTQGAVIFEDDSGRFTGIERSAIRVVKVDGDRVSIVYSDGVEMRTKEFVASNGEGSLFRTLLSPDAPVNVIDHLDETFQQARKNAEELLEKVRAENFPPRLNKDHNDPQYKADCLIAHNYRMDASMFSYYYSKEVSKIYFGDDIMPQINDKNQVPEKVYMARAKCNYLSFIRMLTDFAMTHTKWEHSFLPRQFEAFFMRLGILDRPIVTDEEEADAQKSYASPEMAEYRAWAAGPSCFNRPPSLELLDT
nr:hypothetical protein [Ferrimicrobium acidiphilum]